MKKTTILLLLLLTSILSNAQNWQTNIETAKKNAAEKNQKIILVFSGSDWCAPCIKLEKEIWESDTFISYSNEHYVLLRADYPRKKKNKLPKEQQDRNNKIFEKYNPQGYFPLVVILDSNGKVLGKTGYKKIPPEEYIKLLNSY